MPDLSFDIDWVDAEGINGRELSADVGLLPYQGGRSIVTRVLDGRAVTGPVVDGDDIDELANDVRRLVPGYWAPGQESPHRRHLVNASRRHPRVLGSVGSVGVGDGAEAVAEQVEGQHRHDHERGSITFIM